MQAEKEEQAEAPEVQLEQDRWGQPIGDSAPAPVAPPTADEVIHCPFRIHIVFGDAKDDTLISVL